MTFFNSRNCGPFAVLQKHFLTAIMIEIR